MKHLTWLVVVTMGVSGTSASAGKPALKVPRPDVLTVIEMLDAITRNPKDPIIRARLRQTLPDQKLQVARSRVDISVKREEDNWRGAVEVTVSAPATVRYTADLSALDLNALRWDAKTRKLRVKMPAVVVESVTPDLSKLEVEVRYSGKFRFGWFDETTGTRLESQALREDYEPEARRIGESQLEGARKQAKIELRDLLQKMFRITDSDIDVIVE